MVYVTSGGQICDSQPWSLQRLVSLFYGLIAFIVLFFKTLIGLDTSSNSGKRFGGSGSGPTFRGSGGGGGGGGGGGPGHGPGGGGGPKRMFTMRDINPPTIGGCPGGSCGL